MSFDNVSLCIPRAFPNITKSRVEGVFNALDVGKVGRVDEIETTARDGAPIKRFYVHFEYWNEDGDGAALRQNLVDGKQVTIVYDDPWFWKVVKNNGNKHAKRPTPKIGEAVAIPKKDHAKEVHASDPLSED